MPAPLIPIIGGAIVRAVAGKAAGRATAAAIAREAAKKKATNAAIKAAAKKKALANPKSAVKVIKPGSMAENSMRNQSSTIATNLAKSGTRSKAIAQAKEKAMTADRAIGTKPKTVKINSQRNLKKK
jgi:predicted membrane-bound mannosyltransferase